MKRYFSILTMICAFAFAGIAGAAAQEAQTANPATDFEYDLTEDGEGVIIKKYTGKVTDVVIPAVIEDFPVVAVGSYAFSSSRTTVVSVVFPDSVGTVGEGCFSRCESLQKIILPKNLKALSASLFYGCTALKEIILPNRIEIIYEGAFYEAGLESITIPDSVKIIKPDNDSYGAFAKCKNLQTVNIGNGTEVIGTQAFSGCTKLSCVTIGSGLKMINKEAFHECKALKTITLPNAVKIIEAKAFYQSGLESIAIPDSMEIIGWSAFADCKELKTVSIGKGIKLIRDKAFENCSNLRTVTIGVENFIETYGEPEYRGFRPQTGGYGHNVFSGCSSLSLKDKKKLKDTGYTGEF